MTWRHVWRKAARLRSVAGFSRRQEVSKLQVSLTPVTFIISGDDSVSAVSHPRHSLADALDKARDMLEGGFNNVTITTQDGRVYREADFGLLIKVREK
jgi:hypothetical protein